jgi:hypothetical protein
MSADHRAENPCNLLRTPALEGGSGRVAGLDSPGWRSRAHRWHDTGTQILGGHYPRILKKLGSDVAARFKALGDQSSTPCQAFIELVQ